MKRAILCAVGCLCALVTAICGERFASDGLYFEILSEEDATVALAEPPGSDAYYLAGKTEVVVPGKVTHTASGKEYALVAVNDAFYQRPGATYNLDVLESVVIPQGVHSINDFKCLPSLKSITLPDGLESLTGVTECPSLKSLDLPSTLTELGMWTFHDVAIEELVIPDGVKFIPYASIVDCPELRSLTLSGVERITDHTLIRLPKLKRLAFPACFVSNHINTVSGGMEEIWFYSDGVDREWNLDVVSFVCKPKTVYCARRIPPIITLGGNPLNEPFDPANYDADGYFMFGCSSNLKNVVLYVPVGCKELFSNTPYWGMMDIREYDFEAGIEIVEYNVETVGDDMYYDMQGRKVAVPVSGIYIHGGKKVLIE